MTYAELEKILNKKYNRWTIVEDNREHSITFYLPCNQIDYFIAMELEMRRPVGLLLKARKLKWYQNWWGARKVIIINN